MNIGQPRGEAVHTAILTTDQVREIRIRYATENVSQRELARQYGCCQTNISALIRNKNWKSVE